MSRKKYDIQNFYNINDVVEAYKKQQQHSKNVKAIHQMASIISVIAHPNQLNDAITFTIDVLLDEINHYDIKEHEAVEIFTQRYAEITA